MQEAASCCKLLEGKGLERPLGENRLMFLFFFQAEDGIRDDLVTGVQTCALPIFDEGFPASHLVIAGVFEPQDPVPAEVKQWLSSNPRVHLCGFIRDTPVLYKASDILVLPSYREGLPTVVLEASAMALPVVATRVPGCVDSSHH